MERFDWLMSPAGRILLAVFDVWTVTVTSFVTAKEAKQKKGHWRVTRYDKSNESWTLACIIAFFCIPTKKLIIILLGWLSDMYCAVFYFYNYAAILLNSTWIATTLK